MIQSMKIGQRIFSIGERTYLMGILNVTPDSFSDGGRHSRLDLALEHAMQMIRDGADIIDVGGESTRPDYTMISAEEEIERVVPVIEAIRKETNVPISIDTYKSRVAEAACKAGADLVNDIWGLKYDPDMAGIVSKYNVAACIMHNRKTKEYQDFLPDFMKDMEESLKIAGKVGISPDRIMVDPGIGFAKTYEMNLYLLNHLEELRKLGYPVLLGASRKSVIGLTLNEPVNNRLEGTIAASVVAVMKGCHFIRVHDVRENFRAVRMAEAILKAKIL